MKSLEQFIQEANQPDLTLSEILDMAYKGTTKNTDIDKYDKVVKSLGGEKPKSRANNLISGMSMKRINDGRYSIIRFNRTTTAPVYITIRCKNKYVNINKEDIYIDNVSTAYEQNYNAWIIDTKVLQDAIDKASLPEKIIL